MHKCAHIDTIIHESHSNQQRERKKERERENIVWMAPFLWLFHCCLSCCYYCCSWWLKRDSSMDIRLRLVDIFQMTLTPELCVLVQSIWRNCIWRSASLDRHLSFRVLLVIFGSIGIIIALSDSCFFIYMSSETCAIRKMSKEAMVRGLVGNNWGSNGGLDEKTSDKSQIPCNFVTLEHLFK